METNDQTLLRELLDRRRQEIAPELTPQEFMEIFAASEILKDFDLSYEEIESGMVDGGGDGGIDSIYTIVNGELAQEDSDYSSLKKDINIQLFIIQSKTDDGFKETPIDKLRTSLEELLHLSTDLRTLPRTYNSDVLQLIDRFRRCYKQLSPHFPTLEIAIYYATQGVDVHPNVRKKLEKLKATLKVLFSDAIIKAECIGAPGLLALARREPITSFQLELAENPISTGTVGYLCLVGLGNYNKFISTDTGSIREELFEANVRGYHGDKQVNADQHGPRRSTALRVRYSTA